MDTDPAGFVALGALLLGLFAWLRSDMRRGEERLRDELARVESRADEWFARIEDRLERLEIRLAAVEHGQAKFEGLLEGLREAIAGRANRAAAE